MSGDFNYYTLLGVASNAAPAEIKSAYRAAVAKYHPDVNQAPNAENLTAILNEAWATLQDPAKKAAYDAGLEAKKSGKLGASFTNGAGAQKAPEPSEPLSPMLFCEKCGEEDIHQRFVVFYRVVSSILATRTITTAMRLCTKCRGNEALASAVYTGFLGFWSPRGFIKSVKAMYVSVTGGSMDKRANASMLGYLADAYARRGNNDAAVTTLAACNSFQRNKGIADAIGSFKQVGAVILDGPGRLDGQMYALACVFIPLILLGAVYTALHLYWLRWSAEHHAEINRWLWDTRHIWKRFYPHT